MYVRLLAACALSAACVLLTSPASAQTFTDQSDLIDGVTSGGVGATIADVDGNGLVDLVRSSGVFLQRAEAFEYRDFDTGNPLGAVFGDVTGDGQPEAFILNFDFPGVYAYNPARERFAPTLGGAFDVGPSFFLTQGSILLDYDRDGVLDALVGNDGGIDLLFRGLGGGDFEDVSDETLPQIERGDYGMMAADYDRDGDDDVYVGLCFGDTENLLYENTGTGFEERAPEAGIDDPRASWGVVWLDFDNDGWLDVYVANMEPGDGANGLFRNNGDGTFTDVAATAGVAGPSDEDTWNVAAADFDNDGWLDLVAANQPDASRLYRNNGDGTFSDITTAAGLPDLSGVPLAVGDVNADGWADLFMPGTLNFGDAYFVNDGGSNGWLSVDLVGVASNPDGIGARVEVTAGVLSMVREITAGDGMMSQSHGLKAHFGLGIAATADVTIRWPSGAVDALEGVAASQAITVVEGVGINAPPEMFALTGPDDGAVVPLGEPVTLAWEAATDADAVTYAVHLAAPDGTDQAFETAATEIEIPASALVAEGPYHWAVVARDAYSARTSLGNASFTNNPDVANEEGLTGRGGTLEVWPNPVREVATVRFELLDAGAVRLEVYDLLGRRVHRVALGALGKGPHTHALDLALFKPGPYVVRVVGEEGMHATASLVRID